MVDQDAVEDIMRVYIGHKLLNDEGRVIVISTHTESLLTIQVTTEQYPYRYGRTLPLPFGGIMLCFCLMPDLCTIDLEVGARNCRQKMNYQLRQIGDESVVVVMPPDEKTKRGGVSSLKNLCYTELLYQNMEESILELYKLPTTIVAGSMNITKRWLTLKDPNGNIKNTCRRHGWYGFREPLEWASFH